MSFPIIASDHVEVRHSGGDGVTAVAERPPGRIVGEIALLRHAPRTATVIATEELRGYARARARVRMPARIPDIAEKLGASPLSRPVFATARS